MLIPGMKMITKYVISEVKYPKMTNFLKKIQSIFSKIWIIPIKVGCNMMID